MKAHAAMRPVRWLRHRWQTRHWNRDHGPGCPARYATGDCIDIADWCDVPPERTER